MTTITKLHCTVNIKLW